MMICRSHPYYERVLTAVCAGGARGVQGGCRGDPVGQREGTADDGAGGQTLGWPRLAHSMNLILWHTHIVDRQQCTVELVSFPKRCPERRKAGVPGEKLPPLVSS